MSCDLIWCRKVTINWWIADRIVSFTFVLIAKCQSQCANWRKHERVPNSREIKNAVHRTIGKFTAFLAFGFRKAEPRYLYGAAHMPSTVIPIIVFHFYSFQCNINEWRIHNNIFFSISGCEFNSLYCDLHVEFVCILFNSRLLIEEPNNNNVLLVVCVCNSSQHHDLNVMAKHGARATIDIHRRIQIFCKRIQFRNHILLFVRCD